MTVDLGYVNARLKGMHGAFLQTKNWSELLNAHSLEELERILGNTPYNPNLEEAHLDHPGLLAFDYALSLNWSQTLAKIRSFVNGPISIALELYLLHFDLNNLKELLGTRLQEGTEGETFPMTGFLTQRQLNELRHSSDLKGMASKLRLWQHPLAEAVATIPGELSENLQLEVLLEKGYFQTFVSRLSRSSSLGRSLLQFLSQEIDYLNTRSAYYLCHASLTASKKSELFLSGGSALGPGDFLLLANPDTHQQGRIRLARNARFRFVGTASNAEEIEKAILHERWVQSLRSYRSDPLGPGVLLSFLLQKETEINNLRLLGRAKWYHLPDDRIRDNLVF
jgi:V/A-type H+-transporting ATPase subunit C